MANPFEESWARENMLTEFGKKPEANSMPIEDIRLELKEVTAQVEFAKKEINSITEEMEKSAKNESLLSEASINSRLEAITDSLFELKERKKELEKALKEKTNK